MSFPLGNFNPDGPINNDALTAAKDLYKKLPYAPPNAIDRLYCHWTVGHYNQNFDDYNVGVRYDGKKFSLDIVGDPRDNGRGLNNNAVHAHTYMRNTGALGISTDDMVGANVHDFGNEPVTAMTIEFLCAAVAACAKKYGIDISGKSNASPYQNEPTVLTHAEAANLVGTPPQYDAYGPPPIGTSERWDLSSFVAAPQGETVSADTATKCGNAIRQKAHAYKLAL